jgi:hypothetical protein
MSKSFEILGLTENATADQIEVAYLEKIKCLSPDGTKSGEKSLRELKRARENALLQVRKRSVQHLQKESIKIKKQSASDKAYSQSKPRPVSAHALVSSSWYGSIITRASVLVTLCVFYVGAVIKLWGRLEASLNKSSGASQFILILLLAAPLIFMGVFSVGPEIYAKYRKKQRERLSIDIDLNKPEAPSYFRLEPYLTLDPDAFDRADKAHKRVLSWIEDTPNSILFLSGASGSGKSSVMESFVIPKLRRVDWDVWQTRAFSDPLPALESALATRENKSSKFLVIFDQFEEFLILEDLAASELRAAFLARIRELTKPSESKVYFLFIVRSDNLQGVIELGFDELVSRHNWQVVETFPRSAARRFMRNSPLKLSEELLENILNGAEVVEQQRGSFRAVTLNILGLALQKFDTQITISPEKLVQDYLSDSISQRDIQTVAPGVIRSLITGTGLKRQKTIEELASENKLSIGEVKLCLALLSHRGLVHALDASKSTWEISHDFVAKELHLLLKGIKPNSADRKFAQVAMLLLAPILLAVPYLILRNAEMTRARTETEVQEKARELGAAERLRQHQAGVLDTPTYQREKALTDDIRAFANAKNTATLNMIATSLGLALNADLTVERNAILAEIDKRITSVDVADPKAAMDKLSALLKTYTGKDY